MFLPIGCKESIIHDLSESNANILISRLHEKQIKAEKLRQSDGKWTIAVSEADALRAIRGIERVSFLRDDHSDRTDKSTLMSSREDQKLSYERALSKEIETTLGSVEGVVYARVHLNLPQTDPVFGSRMEKSAGSAGILLLVEGAFKQDKEAIAGIVGGASGIGLSAITVVINRQDGSERGNAPQTAPPLRSFGGNIFRAAAAGQAPFLEMGVLLIAAGTIVVFRTVRSLKKARSPC